MVARLSWRLTSLRAWPVRVCSSCANLDRFGVPVAKALNPGVQGAEPLSRLPLVGVLFLKGG